MSYRFQSVTACNMCGAPAKMHRVLGRRLNRSQGKNPRRKIGLSTTVVQCRVCDLIFSQPLPIPQSLDDHYGVPPESYWIPQYFEVDAKYFSWQIESLRQLKGEISGLKALDVGAGIGKTMIALERAGLDVYGLEPSQPFYDRAIQRMGRSPQRITCTDLEAAIYEPNSFDFISFGAVLEHIYDPSAAIQKTMHWLKPGGLLHIEVPSSRWLIGRLMNLYFRAIGTDYVTNISPMHAPFHLYEFGVRSFQKNARLGHYKIVRCHHNVAETMLPKRFDPLLKPIMARTGTGMQLEVWLGKP